MAGREPFIIAIMGLGMLSGMFSPLRDQIFILMLAFAPAFFIGSPSLVLYLTMLFLSAVTIMLAGIPAAIFERATGRAQSDGVSLGLWAAATAVLSLPALAVFFRLG
jgi:hypothetical protein